MIGNALPAGSGAAIYKRTARLSDTTSVTNLKRAGNYNLRTVLKAVRLTPGATRTTIAQQTGLAGPTIAKITNSLIDMDLIHIASRQQGGRGQPALQFEVNANGAFGIGLNIDRDHLTLVLLDLTGAVRSRLRREIPFALPLDVINFLRDELDHLIDHGGVDRSRILGLGIAIPDDIGRIRLPHRPPEYDHWNEINIATLLAAEWPWSIRCDNDAATAAFGEAEYGTAFDNQNFFYMLISAGLGGGPVIDRSYHRGATARSGEIGLMPDYGAGPGAIVQDTVSVSVMLNRVKAAGHMTRTIDDLVAAGGPITVIFDHWLEDAVRSLVQPLTAINCLINPDAILIGGEQPPPGGPGC